MPLRLPFLFPFVVSSLLVASLFAARGAQAADPPAASPTPQGRMGSPFGPAYDPTRPRPQEPVEKGAGILTATVVAAGKADVEELRQLEDQPGLFGVVLELHVEAGSTTPMLGASSIVASAPDAAAAPLRALCLPTAEAPLSVFFKAEVTTAAWNIAIDGRSWFCGGRTARLATRVGTGGFKLTAAEKVREEGTDRSVVLSGWKGPIVLLFEPSGEPPRSLTIAGRKVDLAVPSGDSNAAN